MNHDEAHGLRVQLATALEESRELRHRVEEVERQRDAARDLKAAAESERDALRGEVKRLREALQKIDPVGRVGAERRDGRAPVD